LFRYRSLWFALLATALVVHGPVRFVRAQAEETTTESEEKDEKEAPEETQEPDVSEAPPAIPEELSSARRTMRTLVTAVEEDRRADAVGTLDFSGMDPQPPPLKRFDYAEQLKAVIDRLAIVDYATISDDPEGPTFRFPPDDVYQPVEIVRLKDGSWRFSAETVTRIPALHEVYGQRDPLEQSKPWYRQELVLMNEVWRILFLITSIMCGLILGQAFRLVLIRAAKRLDRQGREVFSVTLQTLSKTALPVFLILGLHAGIRILVLDHSVQTFVESLLSVVMALLIGYIFFCLVDVVVELLLILTRRSGSTLSDMLVPVISTALRLTVIVLVILEIATALSDKPPSSLIAGLGVSGLAVGLAAQDTLKNFFGSMMIFADRPFELGDRIVIDGHDGPVEAVGFRSTRIRTLDGHLVAVPNAEMAYKTILNIGKRPYIRRVMNIRIAYDSSPEQVQQALDIVREVLANHDGMKEQHPPRIFLHDFLESAINLRAIYWYHPPNYWDYCDFGERVNLGILTRFKAAGIRFALPAQEVFVSDERAASSH
jgi:MscS family membrane protein